MIEIRLSKKADIPFLKDMWKVCFGDDDVYIDFFFENKYKEDYTFVLLYNEEIAAMLTMIPIRMVTPNRQSYNSVMLYAIATHPKHQGKGFSTEIMEYVKQHLLKHNVDILTLVPAEESLIDFYNKRGYKAGFYIKESVLTYENIKGFTMDESNQLTIEPAKPDEYNKIRNKQLQNRCYIEYKNDQIAYQKKLSKKSGADIYIFDIGRTQGCAAVERINDEKVIVKEILLPENLINQGLKKITELLPAKEYILRLPAFTNGTPGDSLRVFGMAQTSSKLDIDISKKALGYLGFAYD